MDTIKIFIDPDGTLGLEAGVHVVVERPTGVIYEHQCAGNSTALRTLEGFLIPVAGAKAAKTIYDWFWKHFEGNCYPPSNNWSERPELIAELRSLVGDIACWRDEDRLFLERDENRITECVEAWIPVRTGHGLNGLSAGLTNNVNWCN